MITHYLNSICRISSFFSKQKRNISNACCLKCGEFYHEKVTACIFSRLIIEHWLSSCVCPFCLLSTVFWSRVEFLESIKWNFNLRVCVMPLFWVLSHITIQNLNSMGKLVHKWLCGYWNFFSLNVRWTFNLGVYLVLMWLKMQFERWQLACVWPLGNVGIDIGEDASWIPALVVEASCYWKSCGVHWRMPEDGPAWGTSGESHCLQHTEIPYGHRFCFPT